MRNVTLMRGNAGIAVKLTDDYRMYRRTWLHAWERLGGEPTAVLQRVSRGSRMFRLDTIVSIVSTDKQVRLRGEGLSWGRVEN